MIPKKGNHLMLEGLERIKKIKSRMKKKKGELEGLKEIIR
jgi:hypothetical protein